MPIFSYLEKAITGTKIQSEIWMGFGDKGKQTMKKKKTLGILLTMPSLVERNTLFSINSGFNS